MHQEHTFNIPATVAYSASVLCLKSVRAPLRALDVTIIIIYYCYLNVECLSKVSTVKRISLSILLSESTKAI